MKSLNQIEKDMLSTNWKDMWSSKQKTKFPFLSSLGASGSRAPDNTHDNRKYLSDIMIDKYELSEDDIKNMTTNEIKAKIRNHKIDQIVK